MACLGGRKICCCHEERLIDFLKTVHSVGGYGGGDWRWWWREMRKGGYHEYYFFFFFLLISLSFFIHTFIFNFSPIFSTIHPLFIIFNIHLFLHYIYFLTFFFNLITFSNLSLLSCLIYLSLNFIEKWFKNVHISP